MGKRSPPGYWQHCLANLDVKEEKDTREGSNIGTDRSKDSAMEETSETGDLIEL